MWKQLGVTVSVLLAIVAAGCDGAAKGPSDRDIQTIVRNGFLGQTYSNSLFGANPNPCSAHFEVLGVRTIDRQLGENYGSEYATVAVDFEVRAKTDFPYEFSCSWGARSDTGALGYWRAGEVRHLRKNLTFIKWESGWRPSA